MTIFPFVLLLGIVLLFLSSWSLVRTVSAMRAARPIPSLALVGLIFGLGSLASLWIVLVVVAAGLGHSRSPFADTRVHAIVVLVLIVIVPTVGLLIYQWRAKKKGR